MQNLKPQLQADQRKIRDQGAKLRKLCLFVDFENDWIYGPSVVTFEARFEDHVTMLRSMVDGLKNTLGNWPLSLSRKAFSS